jgi:hypothetical protein
MNDFSDEVWVQAESCRKYHSKQMKEIFIVAASITANK